MNCFLFINVVNFTITIAAQSAFFSFVQTVVGDDSQALENARITLNTLNRLLGPTPGVSDVLGLEWSLNIVISNKFSSDLNVFGSEIHLTHKYRGG